MPPMENDMKVGDVDVDEAIPTAPPPDHQGHDGAGGAVDRHKSFAWQPKDPESATPFQDFYTFMALHPFFFLTLIPIALIVLTAVGWTRDDYVESDVGDIWIATSGDYWNNKEYAEEVRGGTTTKGRGGTSTFAAMAVSRDGGNLFTAERLEEIRQRMEETETKTKVEYGDHTYTWQDLCSSNNAGRGTTYEFPCVRLSPLDLFQEANWFFDETDKLTWYTTAYQDAVVAPRLERFGTLSEICRLEGSRSVCNASEVDECHCDHVYNLRTNETYAVENGYDASYASTFSLFNDIGNLEMNDRCKICIEEGYEETINQLYQGTLAMLQLYRGHLMKVMGIAAATPNPTNDTLAAAAEAAARLPAVDAALDTVTYESTVEFNHYYVARGLYASLGASNYQTAWARLMAIPIPIPNTNMTITFGDVCDQANANPNVDLDCSRTVDEETAEALLLRHADHIMSMQNTAGLAFPFWNDATGYMFEGTSPYSGSGVDLSGGSSMGLPGSPLQGFIGYLGNPLDPNPGTLGHPAVPTSGTLNFTDPMFQLLEQDPILKWYLAGVTPVQDGVCSNDNVEGSRPPSDPTNQADPLVLLYAVTTGVMSQASQRWCTQYNNPGNNTVQHYAKMWYDLLVDSDNFLSVTQGESDPYVWNTGQGCGYDLKGSRQPYTNQSTDDILLDASRYLYYFDEGESIGVVDRNVLIGDVEPPVGEYNFDNPLKRVGSIQAIYPTLVPEDIIKRVKNCNRPDGPVNDLTQEDAEEILYRFKENWETNWARGWDDENAGQVQFVGFYDEVGADGTTGRMLDEVTLDGGNLMAISFIIIAVFSVLFLLSSDVIESKVLITTAGVGLVVLAFFAAVGLAIIIGIKINITIGWTLPFIMVGLGVDDMYIITTALKRRGGYELEDFSETMKEVFLPITMTSLMNFCMFSIMNISDIPAVYKTAQAALLCVAFLYVTIVLCFPAYCYLDMKRQKAGRCDVLFCIKKEGAVGDGDAAASATAADDKNGTSGASASSGRDRRKSVAAVTGYVYDHVYEPLLIKGGVARVIAHVVVAVIACVLIGLAIWGVTETDVGLGLEDFFPDDNQAGAWATYRTENLASWSVTMNWGGLDYHKAEDQLRMISQFEKVVDSPHVSEVETQRLWMADFIVWTTRHCTENFNQRDAGVKECGMDMTYPGDNSTCKGLWQKNTLGLREKTFVDEPCQPSDLGICRPTSQMHPYDLQEMAARGDYNPATDASASWCPAFDTSVDKMKFCVEKWRDFTGGGGDLLVVPGTATENPECEGEFFNDGEIESPIRLSRGPPMFGYNLFEHQDTVDLIDETRAVCDDDEDGWCWMSGIPYDYWEQYTYVDELLIELLGISIAVGFGVATIFLFGKITYYRDHPTSEALKGSVGGALVITIICALSSFCVVGLSSLADTSLTAFSDMSNVLSVGFAVEYSVHITYRWLSAPMELTTSAERAEYTMAFLFLPTFMAFVSSTIGVICLAFTDFNFNKVYFFRPLMIVMFVTYFFGCYLLPVVLSYLDFDFFKLGHSHNVPTDEMDTKEAEMVEIAEKDENAKDSAEYEG